MLTFHPVPGQITEYLKREIGDPDIELVWMPDEPRINKTFRFNAYDKGKGCFGICKWIRQSASTEYDGKMHHRTELVPYVTPLDGNHDMPLTPGRWLVDMYIESDVCRHGAARLKQVDDWREAKVVKELKERDDMAATYARDPLMYNAMKRLAEEMGTETPSREELIAMERHAIGRAQELEDKDQRDRKDSRFYANRSIEDLL